MKELILLRGLPGSGKSTLAHSLSTGLTPYIEADQYFIDNNGSYNFDPTKLKQAHQWCKDEVESWMGPQGLDRIIVSNTFTQTWEMEPYYKLAKRYGYRVYSLVVENRHGGESVHNVPKEAINNMAQRFNVKII